MGEYQVVVTMNRCPYCHRAYSLYHDIPTDTYYCFGCPSLNPHDSTRVWGVREFRDEPEGPKGPQGSG